MADDPAIAGSRWKLARGVVLSGWIVAIAACAFILLTAMWLHVTGRTIPEDLKQLVSTVLGFFFGSFSTLVRDVLKDD